VGFRFFTVLSRAKSARPAPRQCGVTALGLVGIKRLSRDAPLPHTGFVARYPAVLDETANRLIVQGKFFGDFFHGQISHVVSSLYVRLIRYDTGIALRYPTSDLLGFQPRLLYQSRLFWLLSLLIAKNLSRFFRVTTPHN